MPERLRVAVVGVGHFGSLHADKYAAMDDVELVAGVDQDAARGAKVAATHGCQALTDYRELAGQVDAASLTVPTSLHHQVGLELLEMGLSLLVEKPITETVDSANALIATAKARGRPRVISRCCEVGPSSITRNRSSPTLVVTATGSASL